MRWVAMAAALTLAGCSSADRTSLTTFRPMTDTEFQYEAVAGCCSRAVDSPAGERERMTWLQQHLANNNLCSAGYAITDRKVVFVTSGLVGGDVHRIYYTGRCT